MMGSGSNKLTMQSYGATTTTMGSKSDSSECEEEVVSMASTVESIMKNLRLEISQLRRPLEESSCELEVEAGKKEVEERDKLVVILKQELEKTKAMLVVSNGKLKLKEELAAAAIAAQSAAEQSLQLADSRAAGLCERIEELMKQLEEAEGKERSRRKVRHICWPWRSLTTNITNNTQIVELRMLNACYQKCRPCCIIPCNCRCTI